jgi:hypothetical protein
MASIKEKNIARTKRRKRALEKSKHGEDRNHLAKQLQLAKGRIRALRAHIDMLEAKLDSAYLTRSLFND